jgi:hypothetical protein
MDKSKEQILCNKLINRNIILNGRFDDIISERPVLEAEHEELEGNIEKDICIMDPKDYRRMGDKDLGGDDSVTSRMKRGAQLKNLPFWMKMDMRGKQNQSVFNRLGLFPADFNYEDGVSIIYNGVIGLCSPFTVKFYDDIKIYTMEITYGSGNKEVEWSADSIYGVIDHMEKIFLLSIEMNFVSYVTRKHVNINFRYKLNKYKDLIKEIFEETREKIKNVENMKVLVE